MTREEKYDAVNQAETFEELAQVIESFAEEDGMVQGRTRRFDAKKMADNCRDFNLFFPKPNTLTREFGIRQQAFYIHYYTAE